MRGDLRGKWNWSDSGWHNKPQTFHWAVLKTAPLTWGRRQPYEVDMCPCMCRCVCMRLWLCVFVWARIRSDSRQHWLHCLQELKLLHDSQAVTAISISNSETCFQRHMNIQWDPGVCSEYANTSAHSVLGYMFLPMMPTLIHIRHNHR